MPPRKKGGGRSNSRSGSSSSEGKGNKATAYERARRKDIGTVALPTVSAFLVAFIGLMLAQNPFPEIVDNARRADVLERLRAILSNAAFVRWLTAVQTANGGITAASPEYQREQHFENLNEVRVMMTSVYAARAGRPAPNPDGVYAANRATAQDMHITTGGLREFLNYGAPSPVSVIMGGRRALAATQEPVPVAAPQYFPQGAQAGANPPAGPPQRQAGKAPQAPQAPQVCQYCGKNGHAAAVCRTRLADERARAAPPAPALAPPAPPQTDEERMRALFAAYLKTLPK